MNSWLNRTWCVGLVFVVSCAGCSGTSEPPTAKVKGTIKVDGQPGSDLQVVFEPQTNSGGAGKAATNVGGGSTGLTDAAGNYELKYKGADKAGAVIGKHVVRITRMAGGGPAGGANAVSSTPIPEIYNGASTLTADVATGENKKDFEIMTK